MLMQDQLDRLANLYNKTKEPRYKDQWYKEVRKNYGSNNIKRWNVHSSCSDKTNDERCNVIWPTKFF